MMPWWKSNSARGSVAAEPMTAPPEPAPIVPAELPRYRLLVKSYLPEGAGDPRIHRAGEVVVHQGIPEPHMVPVNDAAHEMVSRHASTLGAKRAAPNGDRWR